MRRVMLGVSALVLAIAAGTFYFLVIAPPGGVALAESERKALLHQAGLPADFPVHPFARKIAQAKQGGVSYGLTVPVADATTWINDSLVRAGYQVFDGDVPDPDGEATRWLHFRGKNGTGGAIIVRQVGSGVRSTTEVKILSQTDSRLRAATAG